MKLEQIPTINLKFHDGLRSEKSTPRRHYPPNQSPTLYRQNPLLSPTQNSPSLRNNKARKPMLSPADCQTPVAAAGERAAWTGARPRSPAISSRNPRRIKHLSRKIHQRKTLKRRSQKRFKILQIAKSNYARKKRARPMQKAKFA